MTQSVESRPNDTRAHAGRALAKETDARARVRIAHRSHTHKIERFILHRVLVWRRQVAVTRKHPLGFRKRPLGGSWREGASQRFDGVGRHVSTTLEAHERSITTGGRRRIGRGIGSKCESARSPKLRRNERSPLGAAEMAREGPPPAMDEWERDSAFSSRAN